MENRDALKALIEITNKKLGFEPTTPSEYDKLIWQIQKTTGDTLSLSSIKRLWGYVKHEGRFSTSTLNILARFNGIKDWESFKNSIGKEMPVTNDNESGFHSESMIDAGKFQPGDRLSLSWNDGKGCELECLGHMRFRVAASSNIKLKEGDSFTLHTLCIGYPIVVSDIVRGDMRFPSYIGAKKGGLQSIKEL